VRKEDINDIPGSEGIILECVAVSAIVWQEAEVVAGRW